MKSDIKLLKSRMAFGAALKKLREAKGFTSAYGYASAVSLNQIKIGQIEKGAAGYNIDTLAAYLEGLDLELEDLLKGKGAKSAEPVEKRKPGRPPIEKSAVRVPRLHWHEFKENEHPILRFGNSQSAGLVGRELLLIAEEPSADWTVWFVIDMLTFEWFVVNKGMKVTYIKGKGTSVEDAQVKVDVCRAETGNYETWDFSGEDAENGEVAE